ncbi:MAG: hypothetical protein ABIH41_05445 [Nanoarchaeota archaeon]
MIPVKQSRHDLYVEELSEHIKPFYDDVFLNVPVRNSKRSLAEVDVLAKQGDYYDVFEVKCSLRIVKARRQASKIRKHLPLKFRNFFLYCGSAKQIVRL